MKDENMMNKDYEEICEETMQSKEEVDPIIHTIHKKQLEHPERDYQLLEKYYKASQEANHYEDKAQNMKTNILIKQKKLLESEEYKGMSETAKNRQLRLDVADLKLKEDMYKREQHKAELEADVYEKLIQWEV